MPVDRAPTPAQGKESYELAVLYGVARAALAARDARKPLGGGLYRGDSAAEMRLAIKLEKVRSWVDSIDVERARLDAGVDGSEG